MTPQQQLRTDLIDYLECELIGPPPGSPDVVRNESPCSRYTAGILFPAQQTFDPVDDLDNVEATQTVDELLAPPQPAEDQPDDQPDLSKRAARDEGDAHDDAVLLANSYLPAAIGLTCVVRAGCDFIEAVPRAFTYVASTEHVKREDRSFTRRIHTRELVPLSPVKIDVRKADMTDYPVHGATLSLRVLVRVREDDSRIVTASLYNRRKRQDSAPPRPEDCYFRVGVALRGIEGDRPFVEYQHVHRAERDPEEQSLALLYRNRRVYGLGHGCATDWDDEVEASTGEVRTVVVPRVRIPPVKPRSGNANGLNMEFLSGQGLADPAAEIPAALTELADGYRTWINDLAGTIPSLPEQMRDRAHAHLDECRSALGRIEHGIELVRSDEVVREAFCLANRAMLMQQYHVRRPRRAPDDAAWEPLPTSYHAEFSDTRIIGHWRTFQLAFVLMNLAAFVPGDHGQRDIVDLIWFPTGGGKTEAYLGLAAYVTFSRRLRTPENAGCTILMRYTLRLLTAQQFQRASALICAAETLRQASGGRMGSDPITIGLWVGQSLSPNRREDARKALQELRRDLGAENPFQILTCPWCGTALNADRDRLGYQATKSPLGEGTVSLVCPASACAFSSSANPLPILVIDEDIYETPPTLLLGTVDKFAMLAWRSEPTTLFGRRTPYSPPELIIQDELHLISGPLGSMVGIYETAIDHLCYHEGRPAKIVASTATIRRAREQCRALYDREAAQFPPSGLDASDNYFATEDTSQAGRIYVGVLPTAASSPVTALVRTAAGLLQGIYELKLPDGAEESARDPYWTLLQYFNSLRELGRAASLIEADIPEHIRIMGNRKDLSFKQQRLLQSPVEMTSRRTAAEIPEILDQLGERYPSEPGKRRPLDNLLATNMISVGVDVDRLGLMMVVGQPKTTSEYIQASSRVGRSRSAPGLVVTLYNAGKPRDRSHYEQFRGYHESFYRHVEPTSVTPFSLPVLDRALRALAVIAARHVAGTSQPRGFDPQSDGFAAFREFLLERARSIDEEHAAAVEQTLEEALREWDDVDPGIWGSFRPPDQRPLMSPAGQDTEWADTAWAVPSSMRNVDVECNAQVLASRRLAHTGRKP